MTGVHLYVAACRAPAIADGIFTYSLRSGPSRSPSRASILTGQYAHTHGVIDNQRPVPEGTTFLPEHLQEAGYETSFIGKWHLGEESGAPRPGFDHWESFPGQGVYFDPTLNINGTRTQFDGYITDVLTDRALRWLEEGRARSTTTSRRTSTAWTRA